MSRKEKERNLAKRRYYERKKTGLCTRCGKRKPLSLRTVCKTCMNYIAQTKRFRKHEDKKKMIMVLGGACQKCGYSKNLAALDFHHRNPKEKENNRFYMYQKLFRTLSNKDFNKKFMLVCRNCHAEIHNPNLSLPQGLNIVNNNMGIEVA